MTRHLRTINALLALALVGFAAWGYPQLPERIPTHFDARFEPDAWGSRTSFLVLPLVGIACAALMHALAPLVTRRPALVNMPGKARLLELPAAEQQWVLRPVRTLLEATATLLLLLFLCIAGTTWFAAHGRDVRTAFISVFIVIFLAMLLSPIWLLVALQRRLDEAQRRTVTGAPAPRPH